MSVQKKALSRRELARLTSARLAVEMRRQRGRRLSAAHRAAISAGMRRTKGSAS